MRAYVAAPPSTQQLDAMTSADYKWALSSFALDPGGRVANECPTVQHFLFDSGAFSVWTKGKDVDVDAYIAWAHDMIGRIGEDRCTFVNLDVIPGTHDGPQPSDEVKALAVTEGIENATRLREAGLRVVEVYHYGEPLDVLDGILERRQPGVPIALGGLAGKRPSRKAKEVFCDNVFAHLRDLYGWGALPAVHGLGISPDAQLGWRYPWFSVDSSAWNIFHRYGAEVSADGRRQKRAGRKLSDGSSISGLRPAGDMYFLRTLRRWQRLEATHTAMWRERGVAFDMEGAAS